jgi:hypothetical protein
LRGNFNLRGALGMYKFLIHCCNLISGPTELSLEEYRKTMNIKTESKTEILAHLVKDTEYQKCLARVIDRYQLRRKDVNSCTKGLYHSLSKHAHGNRLELMVRDIDYEMKEFAAIESVFCALKERECFRLPLKIVAG